MQFSDHLPRPFEHSSNPGPEHEEEQQLGEQ